MAGDRADWDDDVTKIFLDLCIDEKNNLNYNHKKGLTKKGWQNVYNNFRKKAKRCYDQKQLQNKFHSLKRQYKVWKKLKGASGDGWDSQTGTIRMDDEWWEDRIAENQLAETFRKKPLAHEHELTVLFGSMSNEEGTMFCAGGIGDRTPSGGSEDNCDPMSDDNVGRSTVRHATQKTAKEQVVDSPPPKRTKSVEYYIGQISESMLEKSRNESSARSREQDEVTELLQVVEQDGVDQGSELYFIATELFRSAARRASFRTFRQPQDRIAWLQWTWQNAKKK